MNRTVAGTLAAIAALPLALPANATTFFDNAEGISIRRDGSVDRFTGMVVDDEGRIAQLLDFGDEPELPVDYYEDLEGRTLIPGFVDSHVHLMRLGLATLTLDLSQTSSLAEALALVAEYAARFPNRPWLIGRGWNEEKWGLGRFPTAAELDTATDRPVVLERGDGHAVWANSAALAAAGIAAATPDPAGGRIERKESSRQPSGVLVGTAMDLVTALAPPPRAEDHDLAFHAAQRAMFAQGVTAVADMGTTIEDWMTFRRAGDTGRLRLRIMSYAASVPEMLLIGGTGPSPWLYQDRLRMGGVHLILDGSLGSRGALLKADYADDAGNRGLARLDGTQLRNLMSRAAMDRFQVAIDATGDAAVEEALFAIEDLADDFPDNRRWRIESARVVEPADVAMFGRHGIIASMQPLDQIADQAATLARLGNERLSGVDGSNAIAATGAPLVLGSDAPAQTPEPLAALAAAISRNEAGEALSREQALAALTAGGAHAGFAEGRFGTLSVGERADFLILAADPLAAGADRLREIDMLETWIGGERVWSATEG